MRKSLFLLILMLSSVIVGAVASEEISAKNKPKNIIIMIGDGMGYNTVYTASLYFTGKKNGFRWQGLEHAIGITTFTNNGSYDPQKMWNNPGYCRIQPTDSAAAATALSSGVKTYVGAIGVDSNGLPVESVMERAESLGMSTGVVTSVQFSHATPAGFVAHNKSRNRYAEIALEMLESDIDVIMGAGHPFYNNDGERQNTAISFKYVGGNNTWSQLQTGVYGKLITKRKGFRKYRSGSTPDRLVGVARVHQTLQQRRSSKVPGGPIMEQYPHQTTLNKNVPTLKEMAAAALNVLDNNDKGFILMIEGGAIDWAGHANQTVRSIEETLGFNEAIESVLDWVEENSTWDETLLIITADHETGFMVADGTTFPRKIPRNNGVGTVPGIEWKSKGHTNQLVPLFIEGAGAEKLAKRARMNDPVRGKYFDNTQIAKYLFKLLK